VEIHIHKEQLVVEELVVVAVEHGTISGAQPQPTSIWVVAEVEDPGNRENLCTLTHLTMEPNLVLEEQDIWLQETLDLIQITYTLDLTKTNMV
jgi:hypothetical protein